MRTTFEKLTSNTVRDRMAEKIREAILNGALAPGERLVERRLAEQFQTSLTVVRETLIQLDGEGFVAKEPNSATHVINVSLEEAEQIYAARKVIELFAVEEAARCATPEQVAELEKCFWQFVEAARSKDPASYMLKDILFHEKIWEIADNKYVDIALRRIVLPLFAISAMRTVPQRPIHSLEERALSHFSFLEAIKAKDPEGAGKAFLTALDRWLSDARADVFPASPRH